MGNMIYGIYKSRAWNENTKWESVLTDSFIRLGRYSVFSQDLTFYMVLWALQVNRKVSIMIDGVFQAYNGSSANTASQAVDVVQSQVCVSFRLLSHGSLCRPILLDALSFLLSSRSQATLLWYSKLY